MSDTAYFVYANGDTSKEGFDNKLEFETNLIPYTGNADWVEPTLLEIKKFACKALKGSGVKSGIRIIYRWNSKENKVTFIHLYYKGNQENEDHQRIKTYL